MLPGLNPKKMAAMMKQMGIKQEEIESSRVIIEREVGNIVIENPSVMRVNMQGQETWQISGEAKEEAEEEGLREEDVRLVVEKTGKSEEKAMKALEDSDGEVASAIISLSE
jgi:nascent polypeptide-associated complex subunit alpha